MNTEINNLIGVIMITAFIISIGWIALIGFYLNGKRRIKIPEEYYRDRERDIRCSECHSYTRKESIFYIDHPNWCKTGAIAKALKSESTEDARNIQEEMEML